MPTVALTGQPALLLRLLLLWEGGPVSTDLAAHVLRIKSTGLGTYVLKLRDALGDRVTKSLVRTNDGDSRSGRPTTYESSLQADCHEFRRLTDEVSEVAGVAWADYHDVTPEVAAAITPLLDEALSMWVASPAQGFDMAAARRADPSRVRDAARVGAQLEGLFDVYDGWQLRHVDAVLLRADCTLATDHSARASNEVLRHVNLLTRRPVPDDRVWQRLLLAAFRAGDKRRHLVYWQRAVLHFESADEALPPDVEDLRPKFVTSHPTPATGKVPKRATPAKAEPPPLTRKGGNGSSELARIIEQFGISAPASLELGSVGLRPIDCSIRAENALDFAGVLAGKWVDSRPTFDSFVGMLRRFQARNPIGRARFLVIDPKSDAYERLVQIRGGEVSPNSVMRLLALADKFPCLEVRGITHLPAFRVLVIDDDIVTVSPYDLENQSAQSSRLGWEAPHMLLDPLATFPLAPAFRIYFDGEWEGADRLHRQPRAPQGGN